MALAPLAFALASASVAMASEAPPDAVAVVEGFHAALAVGDREAALAALDAAVVIFEAGGAELSRQEYASHHLAGDMEYVAATETKVVDRRSGSAGDHAWVLTRSRTSGSFHGKEVAQSGTETMLLERTDAGAWRIVHIHWSARASG